MVEEDRGRISMFEDWDCGWSCAEWNVHASEVAETLERERLWCVVRGWRCFEEAIPTEVWSREWIGLTMD